MGFREVIRKGAKSIVSLFRTTLNVLSNDDTAFYITNELELLKKRNFSPQAKNLKEKKRPIISFDYLPNFCGVGL